MTAAPRSPLVEKVARIIDPGFFDAAAEGWTPEHAAEMREKARGKATAALDACHAEEMLEVLRWYASEEAYRTEGKPDDTVYDRMHRRERVLLDRGERARALLAKLDGRS